jgi:hypothetical protein
VVKRLVCLLGLHGRGRTLTLRSDGVERSSFVEIEDKST